MVKADVPSSTRQLLQDLNVCLEQTANHTLSSQSLVEWSEVQHWSLTEGKFQADNSLEAEILREILSDLVLQWEILLGNSHEIDHAGEERSQVKLMSFPSCCVR
ncbi:MAG: hypothetical protein HC879_07770 [Leptolyngbyaceae cyanobacterium SL_5_9]|nr:hypothetical protein [Leptolyngbyaceae cyanobacterium SL_5_9]NJO73574.1 hypothetical protein [Leptolyngbyaceae cyanobacterium RM1_406_9]